MAVLVIFPKIIPKHVDKLTTNYIYDTYIYILVECNIFFFGFGKMEKNIYSNVSCIK